jgi:hypothetical protein
MPARFARFRKIPVASTGSGETEQRAEQADDQGDKSGEKGHRGLLGDA